MGKLNRRYAAILRSGSDHNRSRRCGTGSSGGGPAGGRGGLKTCHGVDVKTKTSLSGSSATLSACVRSKPLTAGQETYFQGSERRAVIDGWKVKLVSETRSTTPSPRCRPRHRIADQWRSSGQYASEARRPRRSNRSTDQQKMADRAPSRIVARHRSRVAVIGTPTRRRCHRAA